MASVGPTLLQPILSDLEAPCVTPVASPSGPPVPPQQRLFFYSSGEWEQFIREWVTGLKDPYVQIKQLGGPNDRGVDVAAFKTLNGFEGAWDCFQGKHYTDPLKLSDVLSEIFKLLVNVVSDYYVLPDKYAFLAPRGCGAELNRLLSKPTELRSRFIKKIQPGSSLIADLGAEVAAKVRDFARDVDFSVFQSVELLDALETHRRTPYFAVRFGTPLGPRPAPADPPEIIGHHEARYVAQLVGVYTEKYPGENFAEGQLSSNSKIGPHFQRQRISFYSAEALRLYARDSVPDGTFEALQDDIHSGVVEIAESDHANGMERLTQVLTASGQLDLSRHTLVSVSSLDDRKGICHHLANEDRLSWVSPSQ